MFTMKFARKTCRQINKETGKNVPFRTFIRLAPVPIGGTKSTSKLRTIRGATF